MEPHGPGRRRTTRRGRIVGPKAHALSVSALAVLLLTMGSSGTSGTSAPSPSPQPPAAEPTTAVGYDADWPVEDAYGTDPEVVASAGATAMQVGVSELGPSEIPWAALQAYRRAADILGEVQPSCGVTWTLLAAVGRVESDHGRYGGSELGEDGVARPAIVGPRLDGKGDFARVADTDSGKLDGYDDVDAAVGPMQFLPGTWSYAGVDGDGDGARSPQDIDDAALAAAVYLCASGSDLQDPANAAKALLSYNNSQAYVDLVLAIEARYRAGDFAVTSPPPVSTIGALLETGASAPAVADSKRAVKLLSENRELIATATKSGQRAALPVMTTTEPAASGAGSTTEPQQAVSTPTGSASPTPVESPTPSEPTATPTEPVTSPTTEPTPTPEPTPEATPTPTPAPEPTTQSLTGVWTSCPPSYCVDSTYVDVSAAGALTGPATVDFDGDGTIETVGAELDSLVGQVVSVTVATGSSPWTVLVLNGFSL